MDGKPGLLARQRRWAEASGLTVVAGYLPSVSDNLCRGRLSPAAMRAFEHGRGAELHDRDGRRAKMAALHSSSALVVNVFDHWVDARRLAPIAAALGIDHAPADATFEAEFPTALGGVPPTLDLALRLEDGTTVGVESKFTEWMDERSRSTAAFRPRYFAHPEGRWRAVGLLRCQALAAAVAAGTTTYRHLDVAQLLKHALGLASHSPHPGSFALHYVFFDWPCDARAAHRDELRRFEDAVGGEIGFRTHTYQAAYRQLERTATADDAAVLRCLAARYFDRGTSA